jgi:8-oxo-dGTP diphosphatase
MNERIVGCGVGVFVFKRGKFLMAERHGAHGAGTWSIPGGMVEFGESLEETAKREVQEETSLKIKNIRFGAVTSDHFKKDDKHHITIWMLSDYDSGSPTIMEPDKCLAQQWHSFEDLPEPLFAPWENLLASNFIQEIKRVAQQST